MSVHQQSSCVDNNEIIHCNNVNINQLPPAVYDREPSRSVPKRKRMLNSTSILGRCLLAIVLLLIVGYGVLAYFSIKNTIGIGHLGKSGTNNVFDETMQHLKTMNNQSIKKIRQLQHRVEQLEEKRN